MTSVVCLILTLKLGVTLSTEVKGKIQGENTYSYLVDFSEDAKSLKLDGDYTRRLVNKNDCVVPK